MVERGRLFDTPDVQMDTGAAREVSVEYWCVSMVAATIPETLEWPA